MTDWIEIHWTSGSLDEARRIARRLVEEKWAACAQIIPWIESIYIWNRQLETAQESKIVLKTHRTKYDAIRQIIEQETSYEVPEILSFPIEEINETYLAWLNETPT